MQVAEFAEDALAYLPLSPSARRLRLPAGTLSFQPGGLPTFANVSAVRAGDRDGLVALAARAQAWFAEQGRTDFTWFLGPSATPPDAASVLRECGAAPLTSGRAMTLRSVLDRGAPADVVEVRDRTMLLAYRRLLAPAGGGDGPADAELAATNERAWHDLQVQQGIRYCYLAIVDGTPLAAGGLLLTEHGAALSGGATHATARGRGLYRALVHARWQAARAAGHDTVVVQASPASHPILDRLGFETVAELDVLIQPVQ